MTAHNPHLPPWRQFGWIEHTQRLLDSYRHWTGRELIPRVGSPDDQAQALFVAPLVVLSHGTEDDPLLNYANRAALQLWGFELEELFRTPSRLTAEPLHRDERARLLARTAQQGFVDDYQGIRITRSGQRFYIPQATVWNLLDEQQRYIGQAAMFTEWRMLTDP